MVDSRDAESGLQGRTLTSVAARLDALWQQHKILTPALVVEDARSPESPLHAHFEWDDTEAAARYREAQARRLIRSVQVIVRTEHTAVATVAYIRDPAAEAREQGYQPVAALKEDREAARAALEYECRRAAGVLKRVRKIAQVFKLGEQVDALIEELNELRQTAA